MIEFTDLNESLFTFDKFLGYSNTITDVSLDGNVRLCTSSSDFNNTITSLFRKSKHCTVH